MRKQRYHPYLLEASRNQSTDFDNLSVMVPFVRNTYCKWIFTASCSLTLSNTHRAGMSLISHSLYQIAFLF